MTIPADGLDVFYPIVPDLAWLERLVPLGVRTVQLRLKDASPEEVRRQILGSLEVCIRHDCQLIVNDYWREALAAGADYVHLGQEDLAKADLPTLKARGMRVGISTHSPEELSIALAAEPDYVALGPVWETRLKAMKWPPQGLDRIREWKSRIGSLPLVAIGGITPERAPSVIEAGAQSVAVITDFFTHPSPEGRVRSWLDWAEAVRGRA
ncbi:MAG: thiamine phosphate synthase [Hyphomicrobiaceae bacterium]|nr:thiamine phosphate synthase [Hyphomicrobiaceae bacterium]